MENRIRRRVLRRLIWFCTVCRCHTKRKLGLYGLTPRPPREHDPGPLWLYRRNAIRMAFRWWADSGLMICANFAYFDSCNRAMLREKLQ